jgi:hypothetical protein
MKNCYFYKDYHGKDHYIPTDYYFAELTHNWDADGDGYYGEYGDDIKNYTDLIPELCIGRIPFDNPFLIKKICKKIIQFEKTKEKWKEKALLASATYLEKNSSSDKYNFINYSDNAEYIKENILIPNQINCTTLYEKEGLLPSKYDCNYSLNYKNVLMVWREKYGYVNLMGRGGLKGVGRDILLDKITGEVKQTKIFINIFSSFFLSNKNPSIVYSYACYSASPDKIFSLGNCLLRKGAVAYIGPTRGNKGGLQIMYNFTDYLISYNYTCGKSLFNAKIDYINLNGGIDDSLFYFKENMVVWSLYNTALYGDPATKIY